MVKVTVYPVEGDCYEKEIDGSLESMQAIVGGLIEPVYQPGIVILVDEEGLCKGKKPNKFLSALLSRTIVGQGFIMDRDDWDALA